MRAILVLASIGAVLAASAATSPGAASATTSLRIAYWEDRVGPRPDRVWTLRCDPARGSLDRPVLACRRLSAGGLALFAPVAPKTGCTQIYGGPQRARVTGMLDGRRLWATFSRTDGCEIARWAKLSPWLLPPGGIA